MMWWTFQLPNAIAHVPGATEAIARSVLRKYSYDGAPIDSWPRIRMGGGTRDDVVRRLLREVSSDS